MRVSRMTIYFVAALLSLPVSALEGQKEMSQLRLRESVQEMSTANPMRKIIGMLQDMAAELTREGEIEAEIFEKAMCACEGGGKDLGKVIEDSGAEIDRLTAKVSQDSAERSQLQQEVAEHQANYEQTKKDLEEALMIRTKEGKAFNAKEKDTKFNLNGLGQAIPAIEKGMGGAALMQMDAAPRLRRMIEVTRYLTSDDRSGVLAFLDQGLGEDDQVGDSVKAPQSGEILGILKSMKDEMEKDLGELRSQEKTDQENFNDMKAAKMKEMDLNEKSGASKEKRAGALALSLSEDKHALSDAQEELADATKFGGNLKEMCATKEKERDTRKKARNDEIAAVSEAVGILNDDDALDVFKKALPSAALMQQKKHTYDALIQLGQKGARLHQARRINLLQEHEKRAPGGVGKIAGAAETMVKGMIDGMVGVLHDEDVDDEHKKGWCANETQATADLHAQKTSLLEQTTSEISEMADQIATLTDEIKALHDNIAATDKLVHQATEQRKTEHQEFVDSFATMATATRLIEKAMIRLHQFYNPEKMAKEVARVKSEALAKAGLSLLHKEAKAPPTEAVRRLQALGSGFDALVQTGARRSAVAPVAIPDTPTTYEKKESGGVLGLMEDFKSDLKADMTESETEEKFNAKDYVRIMNDAANSRSDDTKSLTNKNSNKATLNDKKIMAESLKQATDKELHNTELYQVQLKAECGFLLRNFEVRHEGRVGEEVGLESAKTIVTDEEPPAHADVVNEYKEEHSQEEVDANHPMTPGK